MLGVREVGYWPRVVLCCHGLGMIYEVTVQELIQHYSTRPICFRASTATRGSMVLGSMPPYISQAFTNEL